MYNRYMQYRQGGEAPRRTGERQARPAPPSRQTESSPAGGLSAGLKDMLRGMLGDRVEPGDLLLYLVLLLLSLEQEDEELLLVLAALVVLSLGDQEEPGRRKS